MKNLYSSVIITSIVFIVACSNSKSTATTTTHTHTPSAAAANTVICTEPRSKLCTREYRPVCATVTTNNDCDTMPCPAEVQKTYATACTACADPNVISYQQGKCASGTQR